MNKSLKFTLVVILSITVTLSIIAIIFFLTCRLPVASIEVSGTLVDNRYNNYLAGNNLVRIDNKLYFNYFRNELCYGLIEITEDGSRRIYWEGERWLGHYKYNHPIYDMNSNLYMFMNEAVYAYSDETGQFEIDEYLSTLPDGARNIRKANEILVYITTDHATGESTIWSFDNREHNEVLRKNDTKFYIYETKIYYCTSILTGFGTWAHEIGVYDLAEGSDTVILAVSDQYFNISEIFVETDHILFSADFEEAGQSMSGIFKIGLGSPSKYLEVIHSGKNVQLHNAYSGRVYASVDGTLRSFDITSNTSIKLSDQCASQCYIVDDKWVYFATGDNTLWRVTQSGTDEKKVYG